MTNSSITSKELFALIGSTLGQSVTSSSSSPHTQSIHSMQLSKVTLKLRLELSSNLKKSDFSSNQSLMLDGHSNKAYLSVQVTAY